MTIVAVMEGSCPQLEEQIRLLGWPRVAAPGEGGRNDERAVMVREAFTPQALIDCLSPPWIGGIEAAGSGGHPVGSCFRRHLAEGGLGLSLRSDTAYGADIAVPFADALATRLLAPGTDSFDLGFVVQELVSNALLHGNLEVGGIDCEGGGGLEGFGERIEAALGDPGRAGRRVQISAS
ncbi:MAG: chemotaxis protein, partial [Magnetospirillum sp.]|nr:chemotaxis protein [Magnetospirillum sp.]